MGPGRNTRCDSSRRPWKWVVMVQATIAIDPRQSHVGVARVEERNLDTVAAPGHRRVSEGQSRRGPAVASPRAEGGGLRFFMQKLRRVGRVVVNANRYPHWLVALSAMRPRTSPVTADATLLSCSLGLRTWTVLSSTTSIRSRVRCRSVMWSPNLSK